jgi:hypothetical protein
MGAAEMSAARRKSPNRKKLYSKPRLKRAKNDWYIEPRSATRLLLKAEGIAGKTWDPWCGIGHCAEELRASLRPRGFEVVATDIVDRGYEHLTAVVDFGQPNLIASAGGICNIIGNPPFKRDQIQDFVRRAREIATDKIALFLPLKFLASESRYLFFKSWPFTRCWVMSSRPSCPPGALFVAGKIKAEGGSEDYAWFVWERGSRITRKVCWLIDEDALADQHRRAAERAKARAA